MAKHIYHIPLQNTLDFIKTYKTQLKKLTTDKEQLAYYQLLGKSYYHLQIEAFIKFFKIDKELTYALKTIEYFNSTHFIDEISKSLNFSQFRFEKELLHSKDFFYAFCYIYMQKHEKGKRIKTLRKKAYKRLFYYLLDR
jgi:hypothetical protein